MAYILVSGPDQLTVIDQFFDPVGAPPRDSRDREDRRVKLLRDPQQRVNQAAVEVHVEADRF